MQIMEIRIEVQRMDNSIKLFEEKQIRSLWDNESEEWYFSVRDVVRALTDSKDAKQYIKKMRARDPELNASWGTICTLTHLEAADGKKYRTTVATTEGILRIIQSIPSPKAEPFKRWLAMVGAERLNEIADPEIAIQRAMDTYRKKGYSEAWIKQRAQSIVTRNKLTDEWHRSGVSEGMEYAILTNEISKAWSGMSVKEYKDFKGLKKENLRDNMTDLELILNMLAEATTTEISKTTNPQGLEQSKLVAKQGGSVAKNARNEIEERTGKSVVTRLNAKNLKTLE